LVELRTALQGIEICEHGWTRENDGAGGVIVFSTNLNPYGPPDFVFSVIMVILYFGGWSWLKAFS